MLASMTLELQSNMVDFNAYDMLKELKTMFSQQADHELLETVKAFHTCKQEEGAKLNLDSTLLWHYHLGHINKKRIEKLQHDGLLKPTDESATCILNMVPTKKVEKTPYELWHGKVLNLSFFKVLGCEALVKHNTPNKLKPRSVKCIFVGYPKEKMGYSFYYPPKNKIIVARNAEFFKIVSSHKMQVGVMKILKKFKMKIHIILKTLANIIMRLNMKNVEPQSDIIPICRSKRIRRTPDRLCLYVDAEEHELGDLGDLAN
ncbi:retrotransposon protein, putative, ty1-copia subclass [Tanacetum coccineum]